MGQSASPLSHKIASFEELSEVVVGVRREIVQMERGTIRGELFHGSIAGLPLDLVSFNLGVRSRGGSNRDRVSVSLLMGTANRVSRSSFESRPGDVLITPPGGGNENRYYGGASVLVISLSGTDVEAAFGTEARHSDPTTWCRAQYRGDAEMVEQTIPWLRSLVSRLSRRDLSLTTEAAEFWKRAIIEAVTANVDGTAPSGRDGPLPSALKVVRQVEECLDAQGNGLVHISQICGQLRISRRTLHRAFHEALGIGPIAFLRHRRLCAVHTALRSGRLERGTIADLAMQHGFLNEGRFAHYYRQLFGEYPSSTRQQDDRSSSSITHSAASIAL
jgi:AraC-like DNA-binding protein